MDVQISILGPDNLGLLDRVASGVFDGPIERGHLPAYVADPAQALLVAVTGGRVIGQMKAVLHRHPEKPPVMFVEELGVGPDHRRRGVGSALMEAALTWARERGCSAIWLATDPENEAANAFYKATGMGGQHVVMYSRTI